MYFSIFLFVRPFLSRTCRPSPFPRITPSEPLFIFRDKFPKVFLIKYLHEYIVDLVLFFFITSSPMGPINEIQRCPSRVWSRGDLLIHLSPVHAYELLSRCRFSTPTPRLSMVELFVSTSSRYPLRKSQEKCTPAETRTHTFRLAGVCCTH